MVASTCSENSETCVSGCPQQAAIGESLRHGQRESKQNDSGKIKRLDYYDSGWQSKIREELDEFRFVARVANRVILSVLPKVNGVVIEHLCMVGQIGR